MRAGAEAGEEEAPRYLIQGVEGQVHLLLQQVGGKELPFQDQEAEESVPEKR